MRIKISPKDKIFIAGANGMVGTAIKRALMRIDFGSKNKKINILAPSRTELNLLDSEAVKRWFSNNKPTIVILAAAKVGGIFANSKYPVNFLLDNLKIQTNVLETSWEYGVKRLMFLGSSCIYPKIVKQPIKEESLLENYLEKTNEAYAIAKIAGLKLCESLRTQYGFDGLCLMPTNLYGPNDNYDLKNSHVMAALIRKFITAKTKKLKSVICWGSGEVYREFMHVDDLAEAIIFCIEEWYLQNDCAPKDIYGNKLNFLNVGTGIEISIKELAHKIAKLTEFNGEIIWDKSMPDGTPRKRLDVTRINQLGWKAKINLDQGVKETIDNLRNFDFNN